MVQVLTKELSKAVEDFCLFYKALHSFLLELKALEDERVDALFAKYQVVVKAEGKQE